MINRSVMPKSLKNPNSYTHFAPLTNAISSIPNHQPNASIIRSGAVKAELPYKNLAPYGILAK